MLLKSFLVEESEVQVIIKTRKVPGNQYLLVKVPFSKYINIYRQMLPFFCNINIYDNKIKASNIILETFDICGLNVSIVQENDKWRVLPAVLYNGDPMIFGP